MPEKPVPESSVPESSVPAHGNDDLKAKMREALDRKKANDRGVPRDRPARSKVSGPEVEGAGAPAMHRRKAGGGGS